MDTQLATPINRAEQALQAATTPYESKQVEAMAAAAMAWAKEQNDYEKVVDAARIYLLSRCHTTELILPTIKQGRPEIKGNDIVTFLEDYGFSKMQWQRRRDELEARRYLDDYLDECIEKGVEPTRWGLIRFARGGAGSEVIHVSDGSDEWYTPAPYVESVRTVMGGIDLDPASSDDAQRVVMAKEYYTPDDNGLAQDWHGKVYLNPPYSMPAVAQFTKQVIEKYKAGEIEEAIVLVNNATDTTWFHRLLEYPVCFTKGRVRFWSVDGPDLGARQGQAVFYLGDNVDAFAGEFSKYGVVLVRYDDRESR